MARQLAPITETHADKLDFWDYKKNSHSPRLYTYGMEDVVHWICPDNQGHTWEQRICDFLRRQTDCPFCARKSIPTTRSLASKYPKIAAEWHPTKNGHVSAYSALALSPSSVWWQCRKRKSHIFCAPIKSRTAGGLECPFCAARSVPVSKTFARVSKEEAAYWNEEKNHGLLPQDVSFDSPLVVCFDCPDNRGDENPHVIRASISRVSRDGLSCPSCIKEKNNHPDLATAFPDIAATWHSEKNENLKPWNVKAKSSMLVWWKCPVAADHEWRSCVIDRVRADGNCPFCSGRKVSSTTSFAASYPDLLAQWHSKKNRAVDPYEIPPSYMGSVYWQCQSNNEHIWLASVSRRVHLKSGCPKCANWSPPFSDKRTGSHSVPKEKSLAFLYPEVAERWHPIKNGDVTPKDVSAGSHRKAFFQCKIFPDHFWEARIAHLATNCPKCLAFTCSKEESLKAQFPEIARQWHPTKNLPIKPDMVYAKSTKTFYWVCKKIKAHEWETTVESRTNGSSGCPICSNRIIQKENSLAALHPSVALQWHPTKNGDLRPDSVAPNSGKRVWWKCKKGPDHEWEAAIHNRVTNASGCPCCIGRKFSITTTIAYTHPKIAQQWYQQKNGNVRTDQVKFSDPRTFYFRCNIYSDHVFQSKLLARVKAQNDCPICVRNGILPGRTLQDVYPEIAAQWHPTRNGNLTASDVSAHSGRLVYWRCDQNPRHVWQAKIGSRTGKWKTGCPKC